MASTERPSPIEMLAKSATGNTAPTNRAASFRYLAKFHAIHKPAITAATDARIAKMKAIGPPKFPLLVNPISHSRKLLTQLSSQLFAILRAHWRGEDRTESERRLCPLRWLAQRDTSCTPKFFHFGLCLYLCCKQCGPTFIMLCVCGTPPRKFVLSRAFCCINPHIGKWTSSAAFARRGRDDGRIIMPTKHNPNAREGYVCRNAPIACEKLSHRA